MPTITVNVDDDLKDRMERHPEINWSEVTEIHGKSLALQRGEDVNRQAIQEKIETLELKDELTSGNELTESDVDDIADKTNRSARDRVEKQSE